MASKTPNNDTATATATAPSTFLLSSSLYSQLNEQLSTEIEASAVSAAAATSSAISSSIQGSQKEDSIPTRNIRPLTASTSSYLTYSSMSSYYFGSSSAINSSSARKEGGKTKISVSIIGDAFVDLFCFLNDGSSAAEGGKLPVLGGDVRVNQPGKESSD